MNNSSYLIMALLLLAVSQVSHAETVSVDKITEKMLDSNNPELKAAAVAKIIDEIREGAVLNQHIKHRLIYLLNLESNDKTMLQFPTETPYSDEYLLNLIGSVESLEDITTVPMLLRPRIIDTGDGAVEGIAQFGDKVVPILLKRFNGARDVDTRFTTIDILGDMLESRGIQDRANLTDVEKILLRAARSRDKDEHDAALLALRHFDDDEASSLLEDGARSDPDPVIRETLGSWLSHKSQWKP